MPNRFELLVFDWDGTLMDSAGAIIASIQLSCRDLGLPVPDRERAAHVIGLGLKDALSYAVPELPASDYGKLAERYRHHYLARDPDIVARFFNEARGVPTSSCFRACAKC